MNEKKIGLFGGTFNPPHTGHILAFKNFYKKMNLDLAYIMPSNIPAHKEIPEFDSPNCRFNMARLAFSGKEFDCYNIVYSDMEILRGSKTYSIDTVNELIKIHKVSRIYMYIGSDMLYSFETWHDFKELFSKCVLVTAKRTVFNEEKFSQTISRYRQNYSAQIEVLDFEPCEISSTLVRQYIFDKNIEKSKNYLTESVTEYIINNKLYAKDRACDRITDENTLEKIRNDVPSYISGDRLQHTYSVEREAQKLAKIIFPAYGISGKYIPDISAAALLHDITKPLSENEQRLILRKYTMEEIVSPSVYHSRTAAYIIREKYNINERVFRAVYYHTTGKANMDVFEKIIYLADFIEEKRKNENCRALREYFYDNISKTGNDYAKIREVLDRTLLKSFYETREYLTKCGKNISRELYESINYLSENIGEK